MYCLNEILFNLILNAQSSCNCLLESLVFILEYCFTASNATTLYFIYKL